MPHAITPKGLIPPYHVLSELIEDRGSFLPRSLDRSRRVPTFYSHGRWANTKRRDHRVISFLYSFFFFSSFSFFFLDTHIARGPRPRSTSIYLPIRLREAFLKIGFGRTRWKVFTDLAINDCLSFGFSSVAFPSHSTIASETLPRAIGSRIEYICKKHINPPVHFSRN